MKYFPENTVAEYVTQIPKTIQLEGEWEVALAEIHYPRTWNNVRLARNGLYYRKDKSAVFYPADIPAGYYPTIDSIINVIQKTLKDLQWWDPQVLSKVKFAYNDISGKVTITINSGAAVAFGDDIAAILGFEVPFLNRIEKTTTSPRIGDVSTGLYSLYIYCDIVEAQLVGDTEVPLLRIVPVEGKQGDMVTKTFQSLHYLPISKKQFSAIEMNIKTDTGEKVPFEYGKSIVVLHLRRSTSLFL